MVGWEPGVDAHERRRRDLLVMQVRVAGIAHLNKVVSLKLVPGPQCCRSGGGLIGEAVGQAHHITRCAGLIDARARWMLDHGSSRGMGQQATIKGLGHVQQGIP
jgi:hypothetical protein